jgi:hypothetical protein
VERRIDWRRAGTILVAAGLAAACGSEPEAERTGTVVPMNAMARAQSDDSAPNSPPEIQRVTLDPEHPRAGDVVRARLEARDPDGDPVHGIYEWSVDGRDLAETGEKVLLRGARKGSTLELRVRASDGRSESAATRVTARLGNRPPRLDGATIKPPGEIPGGSDITVEPVAHDPDGDRLQFLYTWTVNSRPIRAEGPVLSTRELKRGDAVQVSVQATDGEDRSNAIESPPLRVGNAPPEVVSQPEGAGADGVFRYRVQAKDHDGDSPLRFELVSGPPGMTVSSARGEIEWEPRPDQVGRYPVTVQVDDLHGGKTLHRFEVIVGGDGSSPASPAAAK